MLSHMAQKKSCVVLTKFPSSLNFQSLICLKQYLMIVIALLVIVLIINSHNLNNNISDRKFHTNPGRSTILFSYVKQFFLFV